MSLIVKSSMLNKVDGSAEVEIGRTKLVASVSGPIEPRLRQELPNSASLEIIVRPAVGVSTTREKLIEDKLRSLLQNVIIRHKYPRQLIQIVIQFLVTEDTNNYSITESQKQKLTLIELNAAINACYFALIDANIALYYSFSSVCICANSSIEEDNLKVNPEMKDLAVSKSHHVISYGISHSNAYNVLLIESQGDFSEDEFLNLLDASGDLCKLLHDEQRSHIESKIKKEFIWKH